MLLNTMERGREVRRRGSRMSVNQKVSGFKRGKEKVRACSRLIAEMVGSSGFEEEEQQQQQRFVGGRNDRIKLIGKTFIERGAVDATAVPRKLRSVTIKRNRESMTSALMAAKKQRQVSLEETSQSNKVHKSKMQSKTGARDRSSKQLTTFLVTKDEEDVAEALFALARVFPCDKISKKKANRKKSRAKFEYLTEIKSDYSVTLEAIKEDDSELPCFSGGDGQTNDITVAHDVAVKLEPAADSSFTKESHLSANGSLQFDLEKIPASPAEECDEVKQEIEFANVLNPVKESCNTYLTCLNSYNENRCRFLEQIQNVSSIQETENNLRPISFPCSMKQEDVQPLKKDYLQIGVDFASISNGFAGKFCNGYDIGSESLKCEKSNSLPFSVNSFANPLSNVNKASKDQLDIRLLKVKKSWKKCATHVHITQLIKKYNGLEKNDQGIPILDYERKGNGGSISGSMTFKNEVLDFKNYLNHSILRPNGSSTGKCLQEERKDQFQDNQHVDDLLALNTFSSLQQKQTRDFFSLTPGCISTKTSINEHNHPVILVDSSMQAQLSCSHQSHLQRQIDFMPPPQTRYRSGYPDLMPASTSQQVQLQNFLTSQYLSNVPAAASKQHHHSSQLQHWGHHRPANMLPFSPKWQNGVHHDSFFAPSGLHMANMRPPSLDAFGVKFPPHHQQLFPNISSPSVGKWTTQTSNADHHACLQQLLLNTQHS